MKKKDVVLLSHLRRNSRVPLTALSRRTGFPVSTIFDKLSKYASSGLVPKHTSLLSFQKLGFATNAHIMLKVDKHKKGELVDFLAKHHATNNLFKINNGWDVLHECVFSDMCALEEFVEMLELNYGVIEKNISYVLEEVRREAFLSDHGGVVLNDKL